MNKMSFIKGMGVGVVVGAAAGIIAMPKKQKLTVGRALRSVGDVVDTVVSAIGM